MVLEMQAARLVDTRMQRDVSKIIKVDANKDVVNSSIKDYKDDINVDIRENIEKVKVDTLRKNDFREKIENKVSMLQIANNALDEDREILTKMHDLVKSTDFEKMTRDERVEVQETLIKYIDDINKISLNTKFNNKAILDGSYVDSDNDNKIEIDRVDSQTLGLSVDNISKLTLDSVRVAGESYMPPYSFDVTNAAGAGTALSVIGSAISKIDTYKRQVSINMNTLTKYPEVLELDRAEINEEQSKIRNADAARRLVTKLQNNIRYQINEAQRSQLVKASESVVDLFLNG